MGLEHFRKNGSHSKERETRGGPFGSVRGFLKPVPSPKSRPDPKILAPNGYSFLSNALVVAIEWIVMPIDHLQGGHTTCFRKLSRGIPGEIPELY